MRLAILLSVASVLVSCGKQEISLNMFGGKIKLARGDYDQPQIRIVEGADPDLILFKMQGYVESQDRFFQMDMLRRASGGQLSELYGPKVLQRDIDARAVGLVLAGRNTTEKLKAHPKEFAYIQAYSDGVNQYLSELPSADPELLALYRRITGDENYVPRPWVVEDTVAIVESIAFYLSSAIYEKVALGTAAISYAVGNPEKEFIDLMDMRPLESISILPSASIFDAWKPSGNRNIFSPISSDEYTLAPRCKAGERGTSFPLPEPCPEGVSGSNNWVVSKNYAGGSASYLANDPHLLLMFPGLFYELALDSTQAGGSFKVKGVNLAGVLGILIGHNENMAWGFTNSMSDVDEVYSEGELDDNIVLQTINGEEVEVPVVITKEPILVRHPRGQVTPHIMALRTVPNHGPIFSDHVLVPGHEKTIREYIPNVNITFSYKWTGHEGTTELLAMLGLNKAKNFNEMKDALRFFQSGAQNVIYADRDGNIGYYSHGNYPIRPFASKTAPPFLPVDGVIGNEWAGFRKSVPELYNPEKGFIVTANNDPYGKNQDVLLSNFEDYFGYHFDIGSRAQRITDLIETNRAKGPLSLDHMKAFQFDHKDLMACRFVDQLRRVSESAALSESQRGMMNEILAWDCEVKRESHAAVTFYMVLSELVKQYGRNILDDCKFEGEMKDFAQDAISSLITNSRTAVLSTVYHKLREKIDAEADTGAKIVAEAFRRAEIMMGLKNLEARKWGDLHRFEARNPLPDILPFIPVPMLPRDGSWTTVDMAGFDMAGVLEENTKELSFNHSFGPQFRLVMVLEKGKPIRGVNILPGGNKAKFGDPSSIKELRMWRNGEYRDLVDF